MKSTCIWVWTKVTVSNTALCGRRFIVRLCRVKMVLWTELHGRNKILAINVFALSVVNHGFGVIYWRNMDLQQLDQRTTNLLSMHVVRHLAAGIDWLYALCAEGGRGLHQIESKYQSFIVGLDCYLCSSSNLFMVMVQECDARSSSHSIRRMSCQFTAQLQGSLSKYSKSEPAWIWDHPV